MTVDPARVRAWREKLMTARIELTDAQAARLRQLTDGGYRPALRAA